MNNAKIGAAVLGGYVLGRTKKAKLALSLGALLAGSRIKPGQVAKVLQESPFLSNVSKQVRSELAGAGKEAATTVLSAKADSLADALHERTAGLHEKAHPDGERDQDEGIEEENEEGEHAQEARQDEGSPDEGAPSSEHEGKGGGSQGRAQHRGSDQKDEPPRKRTTAGRSRSKSGSA
ncbi:ABC transporter substrate-binding protein [Streptomyces sp. NPDC001393]